MNYDLENMPLGFDVVIVGAGAAGCTVANYLSKKYSVLLIDSKKLPRLKACSGILVSEAKEFFELDGLDKAVLDKPVELDIEYLDWDNNLNNLSKKEFLNSRREKLDNHLLKNLEKRDNITILDKTRLVDFNSVKTNNLISIMLEKEGKVKPILSKYLVGCDGATSIIRKQISNNKIPFYLGMQEFIKIDDSKNVDRAYFIFDKEITDFYAWVIPKKPFVEIGALVDPTQSKQKFDLLKEKLKDKFGIAGTGIFNSAIVLRPKSKKDLVLGHKNILLCGEAAGMISPSSAEGISYALRSGKLCANAINSSENPLKEYNRLCKEIISRLDIKSKKSRLLSDPKLRLSLFK